MDFWTKYYRETERRQMGRRLTDEEVRALSRELLQGVA
jgi:hypothetical protein